VFSTVGPVPGAILVEWNIRDPAGKQGVAGMWDTHFRIGGSLGSNLGATQCNKAFHSVTPTCYAAFLLLHLTKTSSAYLENVWVWTSDHDLDGDHSQISIYNARGVLIESSNGPVWMYGTASEHNVMYQYNIVNA
jgi:glucan 1,3-beta-glucosidase